MVGGIKQRFTILIFVAAAGDDDDDAEYEEVDDGDVSVNFYNTMTPHLRLLHLQKTKKNILINREYL